MARLRTTGLETNPGDNTHEAFEFLTASTVQSSIVRSGKYAFLGNANDENFRIQYRASATSENIYYRAYIYVSSRPSTTLTSFMRIANGVTELIKVMMNTDGTIELWNDEDEAQIGSDSAALSLNTWYRLEINLNTTTPSSSSISARIDGVQFASGTVNLATGASTFSPGRIATSANGIAVYVDDIAINDTSGSFQNSWPGAEQVVHLKANADGSNTAWSSSSGGADYTTVDEETPNDATDYVQSTAQDTEDFNIEDPIWLASDATVNVVHVGVRFRVSNTAGTQPIVVVRCTQGGTTEESGNITLNSTTWQTNGMAIPRNYALTLYDLPGASATAYTTATLKTTEIGIRNTNNPTNFSQASTMWLTVGYVQGAGMYVESVTTATASATASLNATVLARGSNTQLVVGVAAFDATSGDRQVSSVTFNGDSLAQVNETELTGGEHNEIWHLTAPDAGANTLAVTMGGTCSNVQLVAVVFANANQSGQPDANQAENDTSTTTGSVSVTTVADNAWIFSITQTSSFAMNGIGANQTQIASLQSDFILASLYRDKTPAAATASTYTTGASDDFALAAVSIKPLATGGTETASASPVSMTFTVPSTTATYAAVVSAGVAPVTSTYTVTSTTATYIQIATAGVAPVVTTYTVPAVTAQEKYTAGVAPVTSTYTVTTTTATYAAVLTAGVAPVDSTYTIPSTTATYVQVETAGAAPVSATFTVTATTATYTEVRTASVAPVTSTYTVPSVTAAYAGVYSAGVTPVVTTFTVASTTATGQVIATAGASPVSMTFTVPAVTASADLYLAGVSPIAMSFTVPSTTASYVAVLTASVLPATFTVTVIVPTFTGLWLFKQREIASWNLKSKRQAPQYLTFQNGENIAFQNGDLLYTHNGPFDWNVKTKQSATWTEKPKNVPDIRF